MLNLAAADDYAIGLTQQSPNLLDYIHGGDPARDGAGQRGGVAVIVKAQLTYLGATPDEPQIKRLVTWLNDAMADCEGGVFSTDRLGELWPPARDFASVASGILVISVSPEPSDFIIWFRPEQVTAAKWAGEPAKLTTAGPEGERLNPRKSFEIWKEIVRGQCQPWRPADLDAAFDLRVSLLHVVLRRINAAARERKRAAERDRLLMAELDHRVKNTIANIQALVVQTSRSADSLTGFVLGLDGRIQSMAKAHSLLSESRWEGVSINRLLREELNPYTEGESSVTFGGNDVLLTPKSALSLSLAIHELATNAAKYGALSAAGGRVAVRWRSGADGGVELSWRETGGPRVEPPTRRGFGSTLIERALGMETGGAANIHYLRSGVICEIFLPASSVALSAETPATASAVQPAPIDAALAETSASAPREAYRILVAEDSFLLVATLEAVLDHLGWTLVGPATRKDQALELARSETFDAALLDVNLDGEMSWEVATVLTERGVPYIFSTGYDMMTVLPPSLAGAVVVTKPYKLDELERRLRGLITESRSRRNARAAE